MTRLRCASFLFSWYCSKNSSRLSPPERKVSVICSLSSSTCSGVQDEDKLLESQIWLVMRPTSWLAASKRASKVSGLTLPCFVSKAAFSSRTCSFCVSHFYSTTLLNFCIIDLLPKLLSCPILLLQPCLCLPNHRLLQPGFVKTGQILSSCSSLTLETLLLRDPQGSKRS